MQTLIPNDILGKDAYERSRDQLRRRVMVQKDRRRVPVGDHCTILFENRETLLYQVQEMLRAEDSWSRPGALQDELDAYNPLVPGNGDLSATLMVEYEDETERARMLSALVGLERHVWLRVGDTEPVRGNFDTNQIDEGKISSVQYVRFTLDSPRRVLLSTDGMVVRLLIDHPEYSAQAVLSEETRKAIATDVD